MSAYETIGYFYVLFATGIATAGLMICCGVGAYQIHKTYKEGVEKSEFDRITRQ